MITILSTLAKAFLAILAADFFSGTVHWLEDTFWTEKTPIIGSWLIQPNELHHRKPTALLDKNWWQSSWDAILLGLMIIIIAYLLNCITWEVWVFVFVGANATQIHKFSHQPKSRLPVIIKFLQKVRLIQDNRHHVRHHIGKKDSHYCLITPFLNPILDKTHFWRALEIIMKPFLGEIRRESFHKTS